MSHSWEGQIIRFIIHVLKKMTKDVVKGSKIRPLSRWICLWTAPHRIWKLADSSSSYQKAGQIQKICRICISQCDAVARIPLKMVREKQVLLAQASACRCYLAQLDSWAEFKNVQNLQKSKVTPWKQTPLVSFMKINLYLTFAHH